MTIEQIKYFLAIEKFKSFSIAADELCISQSSLSKQLKSLEKDLDLVLIKRNTRNLELTPAGEEFKKSSIKIMKEYNEMLKNISKYSSNSKNTISIATIPVMTQYGITTLIAAFKNKYPYINVNIQEQEYEKIINQIDDSTINLAFIRTDFLTDPKLDIIPFATDELVLVTSKKHPLANNKYVNLSALADEEFVFLGQSSGVYRACIESCNKAGFTPKISYSNSRLETIIGLVADGLGITLLMNRVISYFNNPNISVILLKEQIPSTLSLISTDNKKLSNNERLFRQFVIDYINKKS